MVHRHHRDQNTDIEELQRWFQSYRRHHSVEIIKRIPKLLMYYREIEQLPDTIYCMENLQILDLNNNQLHKLPESIGQLKNLKKLNLCSNNIKELPSSFGELKNLSELYLNKNDINILPDSFCDLENLQYLNM